MTTKMDVLRDELTQAEANAVALREQIDGLAATPYRGNECGCGVTFETEADFAEHFVISKYNLRMRHLNLGECPFSEKGEIILAQKVSF